MRTCRGCGQVKSHSEFHRDWRVLADGRSARCRTCRHAWRMTHKKLPVPSPRAQAAADLEMFWRERAA